jgi:cellulose biosynthesis protein BcsQ
MQIILILQGKGGVGKTTTAYELGQAAARAGKRVLLVDADSQMNLTQLALKPFVNDGNVLEFIAHNKLGSLAAGVACLRKGQSRSQLTLPVWPLTPDRSLFLLPGSMDTADLDEHLGAAFLLHTSFPTLRYVPGMPMAAVRAAAAACGGGGAAAAADYVIVDVNPNMGRLNACLWWEADWFLVPCLPDAFSVAALCFIARKFDAWRALIAGAPTDLARFLDLPAPDDAQFTPLTKRAPAECLGLTLTVPAAMHAADLEKWRAELLRAAHEARLLDTVRFGDRDNRDRLFAAVERAIAQRRPKRALTSLDEPARKMARTEEAKK